MLHKVFRILILLFIPLVLMGEATEDLSFELDQYNTAFKSLEFNSSNYSTLTETYNSSIDFRYKYIKASGNEANTPAFKTFLQNQQKISNYLKIMETFDNCAMNSEKGKDYLVRMRQASTSVSTNELTCGVNTRVERLAKDVDGAVRAVVKEELRDAVGQQSLENGFLTYLDLQKRFDYKTPNMSIGARANAYCGKKACSQREMAKLKAAGEKYVAENLPANRNIKEYIAEAVNTLNDMAQHPEQYQGKRLRSPQTLIFTDVIQKAIQEKRMIDFTDIANATDEVADATKKQRLIIDVDKNDDNLDRALKRLIKTNPAAVGQILMKNPSFAGTVCKLTQDLEDDIANDATNRKIFLWGGVVVGSVLAVTGVFSWAGAGMLSTAAGGLVTAEALTTVAAVSSAASLSIGVAEGAYLGKDALVKRDEVHRLHAGLRSGNNDEQTKDDYDEAVKEYIGLKKEVALTLGFSLLDIKVITGIARAGKLKEVNDVLKGLTTDSKLSLKIQDFAKKLSPGEMAEMVKYLSGLPKAQALKLMNGMKTWSFSQFTKWLYGITGKGVVKTIVGAEKAVKDVKDAKGAIEKTRLVLTAERSTGKKNLLLRTEEFTMNPFATIGNRSRKLRLPFSMAGYYYAFQAPLDRWTQNSKDKNSKKFVDEASEFMGFEKASELYSNEDIQEIQQDMNTHNENIAKWIQDKKGNIVLPRMEEFEKAGIITSTQKKALSDISKRIYINLSSEISRMKDVDLISIASSKEPEEWASYKNLSKAQQVEKAKHMVMVKLSQTYPNYLREALEQEPAFKNISDKERDFLSSALFPVKSFGKTNDVQLYNSLNHPEKFAGTADRTAIDITDKLLSSENLTNRQALEIASAVQRKDSAWIEKQKQNSSFLPDNKKYLAQRPDIPEVSQVMKVAKNPSDIPKAYTSELEIWKDLVNDPYNHEILEAWKQRQISDIDALRAVATFNLERNEALKTK